MFWCLSYTHDLSANFSRSTPCITWWLCSNVPPAYTCGIDDHNISILWTKMSVNLIASFNHDVIHLLCVEITHLKKRWIIDHVLKKICAFILTDRIIAKYNVRVWTLNTWIFNWSNWCKKTYVKRQYVLHFSVTYVGAVFPLHFLSANSFRSGIRIHLSFFRRLPKKIDANISRRNLALTR